MNYPFFVLISISLTFILLVALRRFSVKARLFRPQEKVPYTGGLAFAGAFFIIFSLFKNAYGFVLPSQLFWIIVFAFFMLIIEFIDDLKDFSLRSRIIIQTAFVVLFLFHTKRIEIYFLPSWANYALSFLWIMGITNAFNMLDISDGLCAGVSLIVCVTFLMVSFIQGYALLSGLFLILAAALFAFLLLNFPPARIYMGNAGSHFLGFLFASLSMYGDYATLENPYALTLPLLILAFPIIDTLFLIVSRIRKGIFPLRKSNDHIALRLLASGSTEYYSLLVIYLVSLLWGVTGLLMLSKLSFPCFVSLAFASLMTGLVILQACRIATKQLP